MPKCELKLLPKCSPCLPKQKQKNTKKLGIGKTHTLENQHSKRPSYLKTFNDPKTCSVNF
jgi:hypothetical protein